MNKEEAIKELQESLDTLREYDIAHSSRLKQALEMAIQALSQVAICPSAGVNCEDCPAYEPCDDASGDFHIGDEVRIIGSNPIYDDCDVGWVIRNASEKFKTMYVMRNDGSAEEEAKAEWYKTGRHNAMLAEVIKALPSVTQKPNFCASCKHNADNEICLECEYDGITRGMTRYEPVTQKSGKWIKIPKYGKWKCSKCDTEFRFTFKEHDYCPKCGAKMESEGKG